MKKSLYLIVCIISAIIGVACLWVPASKYLEIYLTQKEFEKLAKENKSESGDELNWENLQNVNEDICAWVYLPDTKIDYPILQHPSEDDYYLYNGIDGEKNLLGCVFTEETYNNTDFSDYHTVLYGHNLRNGIMFGSLKEFKDKSYFEENRYFYIYTPQGNYQYEIFAAYVNSEEHLLNKYYLEKDEDVQAYIEHVKEVASDTGYIKENMTVDTNTRIVTLSTCIGDDFSDRYLVQGILVQ